MPLTHPEHITLLLARGPASAGELARQLGVSQPTLSRALAALEPRLVRLRAGRSIRYALRDEGRGFGDIPIHRVDAQGRIARLGTLTPVRDAGYVMQQSDGGTQHSEGLPWWLVDMRPQGFMGRAYAGQHAASLGLPTSLRDWTDTHAVRALLAHGHDATGNLLLGDLARQRFLDAPDRAPIPLAAKPTEYVRMSGTALADDATWSSAGGEQPKFTAYVETEQGACHAIVKFTVADDNPVTQRWRDLLLCEHHALQTLRDAGVAAAHTAVVDSGTQRFLEVQRFDRVGLHGRQGLLSLHALDSEFTGLATQPWPEVTQALAAGGHITAQAHADAALLFAYGCLIGNTDMHHGNLSFMALQDSPCTLAPAYDMLPMVFQPSAGGLVGNTVSPVSLHPAVPTSAWVQALALAQALVDRLRAEPRLSPHFAPCVAALQAHQALMQGKIARLV